MGSYIYIFYVSKFYEFMDTVRAFRLENIVVSFASYPCGTNIITSMLSRVPQKY